MRGYMLELGISSIQTGLGGVAALEDSRDLEDWPAILQIEKSMPESASAASLSRQPSYPGDIALAHAIRGDLRAPRR